MSWTYFFNINDKMKRKISPIKNHNLLAIAIVTAFCLSNPKLIKHNVSNPSLTPRPPGVIIASIAKVAANAKLKPERKCKELLSSNKEAEKK